MSTNEPPRKNADGIADETKRVPVTGGTLIYHVEHEERRVGRVPVAQELDGVEVEDTAKLRVALDALGHDPGHATRGGVDR